MVTPGAPGSTTNQTWITITPRAPGDAKRPYTFFPAEPSRSGETVADIADEETARALGVVAGRNDMTGEQFEDLLRQNEKS